MGTVIATQVTHENGTVKRFIGNEQVKECGEAERIEFEYAYGPDLLPPATSSQDGMWRYRALLPITDPIRYPLTVGGTPLVLSPNLQRWADLEALWMKDETRSPTGSNKDRATALVLEHALSTGRRTVTCASTGNVAISLALGAAATGIEAVIFVPDLVAQEKLHLMLLAGATVFKVAAGYEAAVALSRAAARAFGWYDRNTGFNPLTIEGKKTVALEIWEQLDRQVPDVVVVPVGDGVTLNGIAKGFRELMACGASDRLPRILGVQAEGCQPLKLAWKHNRPLQPVQPATIADGIAVASPINATLALRDVRECGGSFLTVSDQALLHSISILASQSGILAEPAGAAAVAAVPPAIAQGLIHRKERVVVLITGSGLRTPRYLQPGELRHVYEVSADLDEVKRALENRQPGA